jgi:hypothetical protein
MASTMRIERGQFTLVGTWIMENADLTTNSEAGFTG